MMGKNFYILAALLFQYGSQTKGISSRLNRDVNKIKQLLAFSCLGNVAERLGKVNQKILA